MKPITAAVLFVLATLPSLATAKGPSARGKHEALEQERAEAAAMDAERARVAAEEQETKKAKAKAEAKAALEAEYVQVGVDSKYKNLRFESADPAQQTVFCGQPCIARLHIGTSYRAVAPGMHDSTPIVVGASTPSLTVHGSSRARWAAGLAGVTFGLMALGTGSVMVRESTDVQRYSASTRDDLLLSGCITGVIGAVIGVTGVVLMAAGSSSQVEAASTPASASRQASKARLLPSGVLVF